MEYKKDEKTKETSTDHVNQSSLSPCGDENEGKQDKNLFKHDKKSVNANREYINIYEQRADDEDTLFSEGHITSFEDTYQGKKAHTLRWHRSNDKLSGSSSALQSATFHTDISKSSPSQYPISEADSESDKGQISSDNDNGNSGLPERYFLITPKEDNQIEENYDLLEQINEHADTKQRIARTLHDTESSLSFHKNISLDSSNSVLHVPYKSSDTSVVTSHDKAVSATVTLPHQFYWKVSQQRKEPMGSENTESSGYGNTITPSTADSGKSSDTNSVQLPFTIVDITVSPAASVNVHSDTDTVSADFKLVRPPLVGQSADASATNMLSRQNYKSDNEYISKSSSPSSSSSNEESFPERRNQILRDKSSVHNSGSGYKQSANASSSHLQDNNKYVVNKPLLPYNEKENVQEDEISQDAYIVATSAGLNVSTIPETIRHNTDRIQSADNECYDNASNMSGPSSLECQQETYHEKNLSIIGSRIDEKSFLQSNCYFVPSVLQQQSPYTKDRFRKRQSSLDSNEADVESGRSGYQSDNRVTSPTSVSSVSSNRKLEWDNGADIGYNAVINAARSKFANAFRSEPEGVPTHKDNINTGITSQQILKKDKMEKKFNTSATEIDSKNNLVSSSNLKSVSNHVRSEKPANEHVSNHRELYADRSNHHTASIQTDVGHVTRDAEVQAHFSIRSLGSQSSADSLSSNSTVKLVNKVGATDNMERRSSLSSPLSEPIVSSYSGITHLDKSLLKSKSDSSTLDVSSSGCLQNDQYVSMLYCNDSIYEDSHNRINDKNLAKLRKKYSRNAGITLSSPEIHYSSTGNDDGLNSTQMLLETNVHLGQESSLYPMPSTMMVQGIKFSKKEDFGSNSNLSKSLSDLCSTKETAVPLPILLPENILPPGITDMSSLRMYLEERYQNEMLGQPASASPTENILLLDTDYEEYENGSSVADGPRIRWYPVTGSELPQDIRDAATQTAVSYLTQHGVQQTVSTNSVEVGTTNSYAAASSGMSDEERETIPTFLTQSNVSEKFTTTDHKQLVIHSADDLSNSSEKMDGKTSVSKSNSDDDEIHTLNTETYQKSHNQIYSKGNLSHIEKLDSANHLSQLEVSTNTENKNDNHYRYTGMSSNKVCTEDLPSQSKHSINSSYSDSETCEIKDKRVSKAYTVPIHLPPLSSYSVEKYIGNISQNSKTTFHGNNTDVNKVDNNATSLSGRKVSSNIEDEVHSSIPNIFPKLDARSHPKNIPASHLQLSKQSLSQAGDALNIIGTSKGSKSRMAVTNVLSSTVIPGNSRQTNTPSRKENLQNNLILGDVSKIATESNRNDLLLRDLLPSNSENNYTQYKLAKYLDSRRGLSNSTTLSNKKSFKYSNDETSVPPESSAEYSRWKVVTEENCSVPSTSCTPSASHSDTSGIDATTLPSDDKLTDTCTLTKSSAVASIQGDEKGKTQSLMTEIKNILSKRNTSSNTMRKYAISDKPSERNMKIPYHSIPSIYSETTMESTHTGSDDAEPPVFPSHVYGSRLNVEVLSPGIYGSKKYFEKYGKDLIGNERKINSRRSILLEKKNAEMEKAKSDSTNWHQNTSRRDSDIPQCLNHYTSTTTTTDDKGNNLEHSVRHIETQYVEREKIAPRNDIQNISNSIRRLQEVEQKLSSISDQNQSSTQEQISETNSTDHTYRKSLLSTDTSRKQNSDASKTETLEPAVSNTPLLNRILSADFGYSRLKPSQLAKRELEKLRHLVDRQKRSYIRRLQREVQRLEKFEEIFLSESLKHFSSSSYGTVNNCISTEKTNSSIRRNGIYSRNGYHISNESSLSLTNSLLSSKNDTTNMAVPKIKTRKIYSKRFTNSSTNTTQMMKYTPRLKKDFSQSFPTPQPSHTEQELAEERISIGIQTTDVKGGLGSKSVAKGSDRYFITLDGSPSGSKKQETTKSKYKEKIYVRKRRLTGHTVPKHIHRNIAWIVPITNSKKRRYLISRGRNGSREMLGHVSLQEAFHINCGHIIKHSQARLIRIAKLADIRQKQTALAIEKAKLTAQLKTQREQQWFKVEERKLKALTHEEMREQTEKIYKKLPEVVEKKEKKKRDQQYRTNRLMAQIYNKKLQEQVLKGKVNWAITQSCFDDDQ